MPAERVAEPRAGEPQWIERTLQLKTGRDPLALQTITEDRIMPRLLPGILVLSQRARYFSFYAFLLKEYEQRRLPANNNDLSTFIKLREFEYAVAIHRCQRCGGEGAGANGSERARPASRSGTAVERTESVVSFLGGYGLYYKTPLVDLGIVIPRGTTIGEHVTPVDVVAPLASAQALSDEFRRAVVETTYYGRYFSSTRPIPIAALDELAEVACLCRLSDFPSEQAAIHRAVFVAPVQQLEPDFEQRRRSFALFLREVDRVPGSARRDGVFRGALWADFRDRHAIDGALAQVLSQWTALVMKEHVQDALSVIWSHFLRLGLSAQGPDGLTRTELNELVRGPLIGEGKIRLFGVTASYRPETRARAFGDRVGELMKGRSDEDLRDWAVDEDSAIAGLALLLTTLHHLPDATTQAKGWTEVGSQGSDRQPSLLLLARLIEQQLDQDPTLAELIAWVVRRLIISIHEPVAYGKLPDFTFRFRREAGRLRFYPMGQGQFELANMRRNAMARLSEDLGLWSEHKDAPVLTDAGRRFLERELT